MGIKQHRRSGREKRNEWWNDVLVYTEGVVMIPVMIMEGIDLPHMIPTSAFGIMSKKVNSLMSTNYDCAQQPLLFLIVSELSDHCNRKTFEKIKIKFWSSYIPLYSLI